MINWYFGWAMVLTAFVTGAGLGLFFHRDDFLGGYAAFQRRILRLGHIALAALGMINVLYGLSASLNESSLRMQLASLGFIIGGISMPTVCFLTSWRVGFRFWFFVPVTALVIAVLETLAIGPP